MLRAAHRIVLTLLTLKFLTYCQGGGGEGTGFRFRGQEEVGRGRRQEAEGGRRKEEG